MIKMHSTNPEVKRIANELKVACEIYYHNINNIPIWYSKLVEEFDGYLSKDIISHSLDTLTDWGIAYGEYGETENGRAGYRWYIDKDSMWVIEDLYEKYYK